MKYNIPVDYDLTIGELVVLDKVSTEPTITTTVTALTSELKWLYDAAPESGDEVIERIMRHAVILFNRPDNHDSLADCLHQAIVWEVG